MLETSDSPIRLGMIPFGATEEGLSGCWPKPSALDRAGRIGREEHCSRKVRFGAAHRRHGSDKQLVVQSRGLEACGPHPRGSLVDGTKHLIHDVRFNGGMPSQVDSRPYRVGETIAVSKGAVVHRTPMFELIQYQPTTPQVAVRPTVIIPPQINRFYFLDLSPGRSFIEYAVSRGISMFVDLVAESDTEHRDWGMDAYVTSASKRCRSPRQSPDPTR